MIDPAGTLVMQLHYQGSADRSPVQMISRARLEYLERMEAEALYLRKVVQAVRLATVSDFAENTRFCGKVSAPSE